MSFLVPALAAVLLTTQAASGGAGDIRGRTMSEQATESGPTASIMVRLTCDSTAARLTWQADEQSGIGRYRVMVVASGRVVYAEEGVFADQWGPSSGDGAPIVSAAFDGPIPRADNGIGAGQIHATVVVDGATRSADATCE